MNEQNTQNGQSYRFDLQTEPYQLAIKQLEDSTKKFGSLFTSTMRDAIKNGKGFDDVLKKLAMRMADMALNQAFKPLEKMISGGMNKMVSGIAGGFAKSLSGGGFAGGGFLGGAGAIGAPMNITPFARGGVVSSPNFFSFGSRIGVMGERGSEAIMPLARGPDGRLGVAASGGGGGLGNITFNVMANDPASFQKSEGQISTMLARVVKRGQRRL